uniref:Amino acid transporter n=1 Tax=Globodera rostochiensis TaxID=31243 RepID=A0A914I807_GLORO
MCPPGTNKNQMGRWGATSYIVGNIVGSGIFITPTSILNHTQSVGLSLTVWFLSAGIAILGAFCYIELGTSIRRSGGDFAYLCHVKWRPIAFSFMACGCILTFPLTLAIQAETFAQYLLQGIGVQFEDEWTAIIGRKCIGYALTWLLLYLNFFSLGTSVARFQMFCSVAKLLSICIIVVTGLYLLIFQGQTQNLREPFANSVWEPGHLVEAFFGGLFSYDGWDILNFGAEDIANPRSTMSFAILAGILFVAVLYLAVNLSYFIVLTIPQMQSSPAVATTFAQYSLGRFQYAIPFLICIVLVGSLNSTLFVASRYLYAAARERQLPAFLSCVNARHESPRAALFFHVGLAIIFSFLGGIDRMIAYVAFAM